ncbi:Wzz/FepE/Etk N-terminal domain-containing protein, partial [Vibrio parahaemolyticus]|uniref:Wzz/FepE/Etk N-terminal domain-containing protein n=1 Tax=Vibrio parahaemolyticus TaxID=670 RepID=UPI0032B00980
MEPQKDPNPNYLPYPPNPQQGGDEIDLRELFKALWKGKWIIIATTFIFAIGSVLLHGMTQQEAKRELGAMIAYCVKNEIH